MRPGRGGVGVLLAVLLTGIALGVRPSGVAAQTEVVDTQRGHAVFQASCAACHGSLAQGRDGAGVAAGPALQDVPVAYVDLVLRTGRMPIAAPELGVRADHLDDADRGALVAWMRQRFELPGDIPAPGTGDAARGLAPFVRHCASCHGGGGVGGVAGGGTFVPAITGSDPVTVVEALRVGPFEMPAFSEAVIDDRAAADIAAYLHEADAAPRTLLGLEAIDPVGTAVASAVLLGVAVGLVRHVARRSGEGEPS